MGLQWVVEADWFVINAEKHIKKLAWCSVQTGLYGEITFDLPAVAYQHREDLQRQSRHSHRLNWREHGKYTSDQVQDGFTEMLELIGPDRIFYSKGLEKCRLIEQYLNEAVENLENLLCIRYEVLTTLPLSTLNKAAIFALWLKQSQLPTLSPYRLLPIGSI